MNKTLPVRNYSIPIGMPGHSKDFCPGTPEGGAVSRETKKNREANKHQHTLAICDDHTYTQTNARPPVLTGY